LFREVAYRPVTQLVYHPAFDAYNAVLRLLRLLFAASKPLDRTSLRILDFYVLFPEELPHARLSTPLRSKVRRLNSKPRYPYDRLPAQQPLFARMEPSFDAALQTLIAKGLVTRDDDETYRLAIENLPTALAKIIRERNEAEPDLIEVLAEIGTTFDSLGANGLKDRTGLAEYRYDAA
jgi:hypothetical protein